MENATEALKIAFAVLIFVIAISATFMLITSARSTADVIFTAKDDQEYVNGITSIGQQKDDEGKLIQYREVGIDTIVPTIYRYAQENYGVIIIDGNEIVGIYDLVVENNISKYSSTWTNLNIPLEIQNICIGYDEDSVHIDGIKDYVKKAVLDVSTDAWDMGYFKNLFGGITLSDDKGIYKIKNPNSVSCPWTSSTHNIMKRLKKDMSENADPETFGANSMLKYYGAFGADGFIKKYQNETFKEYYYSVKTTNNLTGEEETDRIQIIYVKN